MQPREGHMQTKMDLTKGEKSQNSTYSERETHRT